MKLHTTYLFLMGLLLEAGCGFANYKNSSPVVVPAFSAANPATFQEVNSTIFQPQCLGCHGSGASPDLSSYSSFATNTQWIVPGNPGASAIYNAVASGNMPRGGVALSSPELALLASWIQSGAPNN